MSSPRTPPIQFTKAELKYIRRELGARYERMGWYSNVPSVASRMPWHAALIAKLDAALTPPSLVPAPTTNQTDHEHPVD